MRTARSYGRVLSHFRGADPSSPVTDRDRLLALALDLYELDLCHGCGQPRTYAHDADSAKHWKVPPPTRCHSCTAIETEQRKHDEKATRSLYFHAEPDAGLMHAMEHPLPYVPPTE